MVEKASFTGAVAVHIDTQSRKPDLIEHSRYCDNMPLFFVSCEAMNNDHQRDLIPSIRGSVNSAVQSDSVIKDKHLSRPPYYSEYSFFRSLPN